MQIVNFNNYVHFYYSPHCYRRYPADPFGVGTE